MNKIKLSLILSACAFITACGGGDGPDTVENPLPPAVDNGPVDYSGPAPSTPDVQQFKLSLWDNISGQDRCGSCHNAGGQSPSFARADDINLAYGEANSIVNLDSPEDSLMVTKVAGGHNCWQDSAQSCADILTSWITTWSGTESSSNAIVLKAPEIKEPGNNKQFPQTAALFETSVYPLLQQYCVDCHSSSSAMPISPFFASDNVEEAYEGAKSKIDLNTPSRSRFVTRLGSEFHNCWSSCGSNASEMEAAIQSMSEGIDATQIDSDLLYSKALNLSDGIPTSSGGRFESNVIALWQFKTGEGSFAYDTSGVDPAINLSLNGDVDWIGGWGIQIFNGRAQGTTSDSKKLHDLITATGEYSIEAWVAPANVTQEGPARIISYSAGTTSRNFTLGQTLYNYDYLLRTSNTDANGEPGLSTDDAAEVLQATLQHVVINYDPINGRRIYVNGEFTGDNDSVEIGNLNDWDDSYALVLGNEVSGDRPWAGAIRMVAIHNRVLSDEQIVQNFDVGVGEKFYLLFNVSDYVDTPESFVVFSVSQFDNYSYLFSEPFFISLDETVTPNSTVISGLRIGLNGSEVPVGQAFQNLNTTLSASDYDPELGQALSRLGTLISTDLGTEQDEFFLTFEQIGSHTNVYVEAQAPAPATPADIEAQSLIGVKTFAEINMSMARATTVDAESSEIKQAYLTLQQQLPTSTKIESFLSSNQMAIAQMGIKYCNALVNDTALRDAYFTGFDFSRPASSAFDAASRDLIINPLLENVVGSGLNSQPDHANIKTELNNLMDVLTQCSNGVSCDANRTATIVKASCAATLSSAALLIQ